MKLNPLLAPLLTDPTLASVLPNTTVLDVVAAQHSREDDFTQVVGHRISEKQIVCNLIDPDEERLLQIAWKERQAKIHNSFTGPYPLDPTEFNHTDKGENY